jgi:hypothetical protein
MCSWTMEATTGATVMIHRRTLTVRVKDPVRLAFWQVYARSPRPAARPASTASLGDVGLASNGHVRFGHLDGGPPKRHAADHHGQPLSFRRHPCRASTSQASHTAGMNSQNVSFFELGGLAL